ncbi:putative cytochrome P450 [Colletotrichum sublineola]|uniref:Putative cytochrome P450 n=1 Tax=Colletotrichum sublineola TaxID=1173701 RepID=A0A066XE87_COLSU|nr:putative cytochrome P450 [Colletotrichum sublineola]
MSFFSDLYGLRWLLALIVLVLYAGYKIRTYNRLKAFKGPPLCGWSDAWHAWAILTFKSHLKYDAVCRKYGALRRPYTQTTIAEAAAAAADIDFYLGTIARVGPNDLVTSSPELLAHMSGVRSKYTRTEWYYRASQKKYSGRENLGLEDSIDSHVSDLIDLIRSKYISTEAASKPMDLAQKVQYLTLDVISDISFGKAFGDLRADDDMFGIAASSDTGMVIFTYKIALGLYKVLQSPLAARLFGPRETDATGWGRMFANGRAIVKARLALGTQQRSDMIASFIRHGLSEDEILSETTLQMIAGSDTTAASLRAVMLYLLTHPRVYTKLRAEIDAFVEGDGGSDGAEAARPFRIVSDADCRKLPYLQAVIKEGMRVHPPVTNMDPKRVPDGGDTVVLDGRPVFLPGGTNVSCAAWPLHLDKGIFGEDAELFRPERWLLETDEKRLTAMHRVHELMFGYGKYQCLGRPIAMMEIGKTVFEHPQNDIVQLFANLFSNPITEDMGFSHSVSTEIEIQASPADVRSVFLDFQRYKEWSQGWTLTPTEPGKNPSDLKDGDQIQANMKSMAFKPVIKVSQGPLPPTPPTHFPLTPNAKENTSEALHWVGSLPGIFTGRHQFYFKPSDVNPGGTRFIQAEDFSGLLAFLMAPGWSFREKTLAGWNEFNADLKKEVERRPS